MEGKVKKRFKIAEEKLAGLTLTREEENRIREITSNKTGYYRVKYIFLLRKKGMSKREICLILKLGYYAFEKWNGLIDTDNFLKSRIIQAIEEEKDITTYKEPREFNNYTVEQLQGKIRMVLNSITPEKIMLSDLPDLVRSFSLLFDKYRTASGQSNINILGINVLQSRDSDLKRMEELKKQIQDISLLLNEKKFVTNREDLDEQSVEAAFTPKQPTIITKSIKTN